MNTESVRRSLLMVLWLALVLVPPSAFADGVCSPGGSTGGACPGAPITGPVGATLPAFEAVGQVTFLPPGATVVAGDVIVNDDPAGTSISDILRFIDIGGGVAVSYILFSDVSDPEDTGIPLPGTNIFTIVEGPGVPTGYLAISASGPANSYAIFSDLATPDVPVPEPSTFLLLASGLLGLTYWQRKHTA